MTDQTFLLATMSFKLALHVCSVFAYVNEAPILESTTVNNKAKNMESVTFFKTTWHARALGHLDCFA